MEAIALTGKRIVFFIPNLTPSKRALVCHLSKLIHLNQAKLLIVLQKPDFLVQANTPTSITFLFLKPDFTKPLQFQFILADIKSFAPDIIMFFNSLNWYAFLLRMTLKNSIFIFDNTAFFDWRMSWYRSLFFRKNALLLFQQVISFRMWQPTLEKITLNPIKTGVLVSANTFQYLLSKRKDFFSNCDSGFLVYHFFDEKIENNTIVSQGCNLPLLLSSAKAVFVAKELDFENAEILEAFHLKIPVFSVIENSDSLKIWPLLLKNISLEEQLKTYDYQNVKDVLNEVLSHC